MNPLGACFFVLIRNFRNRNTSKYVDLMILNRVKKIQSYILHIELSFTRLSFEQCPEFGLSAILSKPKHKVVNTGNLKRKWWWKTFGLGNNIRLLRSWAPCKINVKPRVLGRMWYFNSGIFFSRAYFMLSNRFFSVNRVPSQAMRNYDSKHGMIYTLFIQWSRRKRWAYVEIKMIRITIDQSLNVVFKNSLIGFPNST